MQILILYFIRGVLLRRSPSVGGRLCSILQKRGVVGVKGVSDCLSVLREGVSRGEDGLRDVLLVVIHILMVVFLIHVFVILLAEKSVVIAVAFGGNFVQV